MKKSSNKNQPSATNTNSKEAFYSFIEYDSDKEKQETVTFGEEASSDSKIRVINSESDLRKPKKVMATEQKKTPEVKSENISTSKQIKS